MRSKKAVVDIILEWAMGIVIGAVVFIAFNNAGYSWGNAIVVEKMNAANIIGLTIGQLESSPMDTIVDIHMDLTKFIISVDNRCVTVKENELDITKASYCFPITNQITPTTIEHPERLYAIKNNKGIALASKLPEKIYQETCNPLPPNLSESYSILIDPIFDKIDDEFVLKLSENLYSNLNSRIETTDIALVSPRNHLTKISDEELSRKMNSADIIIKIKAIDSKATSVYARVNKKDDLGNALSCASLNNLMNIKNIKSVSKLVSADSEQKVITFEFPIVLDSSDSIKTYEYGQKIAEAVYSALQ